MDKNISDLIQNKISASSRLDIDKGLTGDEVKGVAGDLRSNIEKIVSNGIVWPQSSSSIGFLPPLLVSPNKEFLEWFNKYDTNSNNRKDVETLASNNKYKDYEYEDWLGQKITPSGIKLVDISDEYIDKKFQESKNIPKSLGELESSPYTTRDHYLIFNDNATDYFKHGLQIIDGLNPMEFKKDGELNSRLGNFKNTPFENSDPVIFGFEIVIDAVTSPLLNGAIKDFLNSYQGINEVRARIPVYEDFKQQFIKFFRTKAAVNINGNPVEAVNINEIQTVLSKSKTTYANTENSKSNLYNSSKLSYMNYYLKKVDGLDKLSESNTSSVKNFLVDYRTDVIKLDFNEDVSLSVGTLAHLYKLLYWSKPNGKNIVPENLLRFNCDIIVSECRNFNRVRKAISDGNLEVLKDNLSRYVYSLKECQLYFNTLPHTASIDISAPVTYDNYTIEFDYKYSTVLFEKFLEKGDGFGAYAGYDSGAIWKIGNAGSRNNADNTIDTSQPKFYTEGQNKFNQNGVKNPFIIKRVGPKSEVFPVGSDLEMAKMVVPKRDLSIDKKELDNITNKLKSEASLSKINLKKPIGNFIERLKKSTIKSVKQEISKLVNNRVNILSRTINKLGIGLVGGKGIRPPQNVYAPDQGALGNALSNISDRFFYDIRNELTDFAGGSLSNFLNNGISGFTKK